MTIAALNNSTATISCLTIRKSPVDSTAISSSILIISSIFDLARGHVSFLPADKGRHGVLVDPETA
jgi:hypothetical protein